MPYSPGVCEGWLKGLPDLLYGQANSFPVDWCHRQTAGGQLSAEIGHDGVT